MSETHIRQALGITNPRDVEELRWVLTSDSRFVERQANYWMCVPLEELITDRPISDVTFVITDIETTGSIRGKDRIIEIAASKIKNGKCLGTFESLVNPQKNISKQIVRLTKITNATVRTSPTIEEVLPEYVKFAGSGLFVAHNSLFDFSFINTEIERLKLPKLKSQVDVCTYRLAQRLLPQVRARGVSGLSLYFNYHMENRHRAMPDVMATHYFLNRFIEQLKERNVVSLYQLIDFQKERLTLKELLKKVKRQKRRHYYTRAIA